MPPFTEMSVCSVCGTTASDAGLVRVSKVMADGAGQKFDSRRGVFTAAPSLTREKSVCDHCVSSTYQQLYQESLIDEDGDEIPLPALLCPACIDKTSEAPLGFLGRSSVRL
eukprot:TRINITY_DN57791_c0_g1_i1.p1 TRINITY_DN57791_c0_g1~~TRINITY_DN57791_c0_g1_i1.p1  ORF type:complete len:111 (+),score=36.79 TRINITY_DN57791_c0_g1_i1:257-589(+)